MFLGLGLHVTPMTTVLFASAVVQLSHCRRLVGRMNPPVPVPGPGPGPGPGQEPSRPFSIIALPDTQYYSRNENDLPLFIKQTQWIADEVKGTNPRNIVFVSHLGDVVDADEETQWERANTSMSLLGRPGGPFVVPFSMLPGNHDFHVCWGKETHAKQFLSYFGPQRFEGAEWYGGADPSGQNSFQYFEGGGTRFLHLALEWAPVENVPERSPSPLDWASQVLLAHPTMPVILSTHEYISDDPGGRSRRGDAIFDKLVRQHDQIFLVLSGHFHDRKRGARELGGEWHQVSINKFGRPVIEVFQNYQDYPHSGSGWLRIITFDLQSGNLRFETYSPELDKYRNGTEASVGQYASNFAFPFNASRLADMSPRRSGDGPSLRHSARRYASL